MVFHTPPFRNVGTPNTTSARTQQQGMPLRRSLRLKSRLSTDDSLLQHVLPTDLIHRIAHFLGADDALSASRTCRCLREAALCEGVWRALSERLRLQHVRVRCVPAGPALTHVRRHLMLRTASEVRFKDTSRRVAPDGRRVAAAWRVASDGLSATTNSVEEHEMILIDPD